MKQTKPFSVTKRQVWEAWKRVKANQGGAGIDGESIGDFEANLENNGGAPFSVGGRRPQ